MREKLNENPIAQIAVVAVLFVVAAIFFLAPKGSEEESAPPATSESAAVVSSAAAPAELPPPGSGVGAAPPLPHPLIASFVANETVVLLFVRDGGIDDGMVASTVDRLDSMSDVATFVVPAKRIARYAAITQDLDLNRVPALVVLRPKHLDDGVPTASIHYGYQSPQSVAQAVIDARYKGHTLDYHP
jgi:hypothetical protein